MLAIVTKFAYLAALTGPQPDPLGHLVTEALRYSLTLAAERLAEQRAASDVSAARGRFLPSVTLDARYSEQNGSLNLGDVLNPAFAALNEMRGSSDLPTRLDLTLPFAHESRVRLTQPLFNEGIRHNYRLAEQRHAGQRHQRQAAARRLAAQVQVAYVSWAAARSAAAVYAATLGLVAENERVAERLLAAGQATPDALFRARAERSDVVQRLAAAQEEVSAAARALNQLLGRPFDAGIDAVPDSVLLVELTISEDHALASALARREELAELDAGIGAADAAVGLATAAFLPTVGLAVDYGFQSQDLRFGRGSDFWMASLVVSWDLFSGGRDLARRHAAQAEAERARVSRRDLADRIRLEVRQVYQAAVVAHAAIATADDRLAAARRTFDLVRRRYEEGVATQVEFIDARTQLTNAALNRALTAYRYVIRHIDLERAAALRAID